MEKVKYFWQHHQEFNIESNYFKLVDSICLLFEQRPPLTDSYSIKAIWAALSVFHTLQYLCYSVQLVRCVNKSPLNVEELTSIANLLVVLTVSVIRGLNLAYHRDDMLELKQYINEKSCRRSDPYAFVLRKSKYLKINRYAIWFYIVTTVNSFTWALTTGLKEDVFKIPYLIDGLSDSARKMINTCFSILFIPWCYTTWYSPTQFITLLSILHTELTIIVGQFEDLFHKVIATYALDVSEMNKMTKMQINRFWIDLDDEFKTAISHHTAFVRKLVLLRNISSVNFFIFLCSSTLITTFNIFLFLMAPSLGRLPLLLLAIQYISETYLCCTMFNSLENENNRINYMVYAQDWLNGVIKHKSSDRPYCISVFRNAVILHQQVNKGLTIRAGGIFPLNLHTFTTLMRSVYSLLTILLQSIEMKPSH